MGGTLSGSGRPLAKGLITAMPLRDQVAAISVVWLTAGQWQTLINEDSLLKPMPILS